MRAGSSQWKITHSDTMTCGVLAKKAFDAKSEAALLVIHRKATVEALGQSFPLSEDCFSFLEHIPYWTVLRFPEWNTKCAQEEPTMTKNVVSPAGGSKPPPPSLGTQRVADILEQELDSVICEWNRLVEKEPDLIRIPLNFEERTGHLPKLLQDVIARLRLGKGLKAPVSVAAGHHGQLRCKQGYTAAMVVDESRILQVCIFSTLHKNEYRVKFSRLLPDVVTIADEVDAQLMQQILCFQPVEDSEKKY
jgi:hypothetical protein